MKNPFQIGDELTYEHQVTKEDVASFSNAVVHEVYSTFALGRDAEWACRLFVLSMKEEDEEGIGTYLAVKHLSPAKVGTQVTFIASLKEVHGNHVVCTFTALTAERLIASGEQHQKILKKEKLAQIMANL